MPDGADVTLPPPVIATANAILRANIAVTELDAVSVVEQLGTLPVHAPVHVTKTESAAGAADKVTCVLRS
jgi:hypothetical protein